MKTIAQQIKWDFKTNGDLIIRDKNGNKIYHEDSAREWVKREWDSQGNLIYFEYSDGRWTKYEFDSKGSRIYYENSHGVIVDSRPKPCEGKIVEFEGEKFKLTKV